MKFLVNDHIRSELNATHNKATERKREKKIVWELAKSWTEKKKNDDNKISDDDN